MISCYHPVLLGVQEEGNEDQRTKRAALRGPGQVTVTNFGKRGLVRCSALVSSLGLGAGDIPWPTLCAWAIISPRRHDTASRLDAQAEAWRPDLNSGKVPHAINRTRLKGEWGPDLVQGRPPNHTCNMPISAVVACLSAGCA